MCLSINSLSMLNQSPPLSKIYSRLTESTFDTKCSALISRILLWPFFSRFPLDLTGKPLWYIIQWKPQYNFSNLQLTTGKMKNDIPSFFLEFQARWIKFFCPKGILCISSHITGRNKPRMIQVFFPQHYLFLFVIIIIIVLYVFFIFIDLEDKSAVLIHGFTA